MKFISALLFAVAAAYDEVAYNDYYYEYGYGPGTGGG